MTIAALVTEGIGPGSTIKLVLTGGLDIGAAVAAVKAGLAGRRRRRLAYVEEGDARYLVDAETYAKRRVEEPPPVEKPKRKIRAKATIAESKPVETPKLVAVPAEPSPLEKLVTIPAMDTGLAAELIAEDQRRKKRRAKAARDAELARVAAEEAELEDEEALMQIILAAA